MASLENTQRPSERGRTLQREEANILRLFSPNGRSSDIKLNTRGDLPTNAARDFSNSDANYYLADGTKRDDEQQLDRSDIANLKARAGTGSKTRKWTAELIRQRLPYDPTHG